MPRERIATRDVVFHAADDINRRGEKVTVASVRDVIGGGSNTTIHEILVEWRRQRRERLPMPLTAANVVPLAGTVPAMPDPLRQLVDGFAAQLNRRWTEALSNSLGLDDQMAVIRAAAEARVREAEETALALEDELEELRALLIAAETERDALHAALEAAELLALSAPAGPALQVTGPGSGPGTGALGERGAAPRLALPFPSSAVPPAQAPAQAPSPAPSAAEAGSGLGPAVAGSLVQRLEDELSRALDERDALAREVALLRAEMEGRANDEILRRQQSDRAALEEAVKSAEAARDLMKTERDRLKDDMARLRAAAGAMRDEGERLSAERKRLATEVINLQDRVERQNAWIQQARIRLEAAGLLKKRS